MSKEKKRWRLSTPALAGIVALASGAVTLLFTLSPSLKPDPGNAINAQLRVLDVEPHARYSAYLRRLGDDAPPEKVGPDVLNQSGYIVNLSVTVNGRKRHDIRLRKIHYVAGSNRRWTAPQPVGNFRSDTPSDAWVIPVFVVAPLMADGYRFFERFELVDRNTILALANTKDLEPAQ